MSNLNGIMKLDDNQLDEYDDEAISDVIVKLEKSFGLQFETNAFYHVKTFGDLCDVFENRMNYDHRDDCTKQQAFYRVRKAISAIQSISEKDIKPESKLIDFFPYSTRRQKAKEFKSYMGTNIKILTYPGWLALTFLTGLLLSFAAFFFDWKIALAGTAFFILAFQIAERLGKDLALQTVRELTEKLTRENYMDVRRIKGTANRREVSGIITDTFSDALFIDKKYLTREAKFGWAR